jgi:regulator of PEP synthase PpsR (kinase-PPPase family)
LSPLRPPARARAENRPVRTLAPCAFSTALQQRARFRYRSGMVRPGRTRRRRMHSNRSYFHLHLVSDSTGETLLAVSRAVTAQYQGVSAIEHLYPLVRTRSQLDRVLTELERQPGMVLFTLVDETLTEVLEGFCREIGAPCLSILAPVLAMFGGYLGTSWVARPGAQHMLNAEYFRRIDALNFTMMHDDGQLPTNLSSADVVLVGVSRTSKTPTAMYLANRGIKAANVPFVVGRPLPPGLLEPMPGPLIVGLVATPERIVQIRQNRMLSLNMTAETDYIDREAVTEEIVQSRRLFSRQNWPVIDVTRRSIEETAAAIIELHRQHRETSMVET